MSNGSAYPQQDNKLQHHCSIPHAPPAADQSSDPADNSPAESHAILVKLSLLNSVRTTTTKYLRQSTCKPSLWAKKGVRVAGLQSSAPLQGKNKQSTSGSSQPSHPPPFPGIFQATITSPTIPRYHSGHLPHKHRTAFKLHAPC